MSRSILRVAAMLFALACIFIFLPNESSAEWRWAKPLNQKPGSLLYSTNPAFRNRSVSPGYSYRTRSAYNSKPVFRANSFGTTRRTRGIFFRR